MFSNIFVECKELYSNVKHRVPIQSSSITNLQIISTHVVDLHSLCEKMSLDICCSINQNRSVCLQCVKCIYAYMGFAVFTIFFGLVGAIVIQLFQKANLHIDAISLCFILFNFSVSQCPNSRGCWKQSILGRLCEFDEGKHGC